MWHMCPFCIYLLFHFVDADRKTVVSRLVLLWVGRSLGEKRLTCEDADAFQTLGPDVSVVLSAFSAHPRPGACCDNADKNPKNQHRRIDLE